MGKAWKVKDRDFSEYYFKDKGKKTIFKFFLSEKFLRKQAFFYKKINKYSYKEVEVVIIISY